jgi:hypothetical protein
MGLNICNIVTSYFMKWWMLQVCEWKLPWPLFMTTVAIWYWGLLSTVLIHTGHWPEFCPVHLWGIYVNIHVTEVVRVFLWYPYPNLLKSQFIHFSSCLNNVNLACKKTFFLAKYVKLFQSCYIMGIKKCYLLKKCTGKDSLCNSSSWCPCILFWSPSSYY